MANNILLAVAHCDDETFGCGGAVRRHVEAGDRVYAIAFTNGVGSRTGTGQEQAAVQERFATAQRAAETLGFTWLRVADWPDNGLDQVPLLELAKFIEAAKAEVQPAIVYTHARVDLNVDHRCVHDAVLTAFRPQPGESWQEIRAFEVPSATDWGVRGVFAPQLSIDISRQWPAKEQALRCYGKELRAFPHTRSLQAIQALAVLRGAQAGFEMAEAFEIVRKRVGY